MALKEDSKLRKDGGTGGDGPNTIVDSKAVGVTFFSGNHAADFKSRIMEFFREWKLPERKLVQPLKDITFEGHEGEILGIIGSNGAGKSTLSRIISGILQEDYGVMEVKGKVTALFSFGMGFNPELPGRENVYLNGMMLGIDKKEIDRYIDDIKEFSDLGDFFEQPMKFYSSGMKSRLGFSVAANLHPEILILDEALNTGDAKFSKKAAVKMRSLVKEAKMVILVTHSLGYAQNNCDRVMWLDGGEVREIGDPKTVIANYRATVPKRPPRKKGKLQLRKTETEMTDNVVIRAKDVGVKYKLTTGDFWALKDVNFEVREGEVVGIIGHNGAGKSTLCKTLTKILRPDEGELELYGETSALLGYGTGFNPHLTGEDNIYLNALLLGIPKWRVDEKYDQIVEFTGLGDKVKKPVKDFSSGQKARLGFSIAANLQPDIFIVDEALSTGDLAFQQKASERIQEMMSRAKVVIIVSHSLAFIEKICTRGIWMEQGRVMYDGTAEEAVYKYKEAQGLLKQPAQKKQIREGRGAASGNGRKRNAGNQQAAKQQRNNEAKTHE
ncbi:ABC transporter ATP-binding protein [Lacicoccus alkaliphilus]|uniref:Teichoic acid transport system ATP-binding protein n=1 Tax=Lacicoccus alkaliphilus DSM 16010 TaxID=1123231 RepID=A0A1M7H745_9BACL|nr:ATP-binding cassette domain-containing protein [Salinicoccus alkaliphilus]SHM23877.1 teichoic acid transport system ATP-binding protein [Salinicoccus alkaliphilus DSM 16010]